MGCVSWLVKSDGTSGGRVLTVVHNLNNDKQRHHHHLSFGWQLLSAPGNSLVLMWPALIWLVTCCCHIVLVVVVVHVGGWKQVAAIDHGVDESMVVVTEGGGE